MDNMYDLYERGLRGLLDAFSSEEDLFCEIATYKSRFLMSVQNLRLYGEQNPIELAEIHQILHQLHRICHQKLGMDFDIWTTTCVTRELRQMQQDPLYQYLGNWQELQDGRLQEFLLTRLTQRGITIQTQRIALREDPIERHKRVPLHAYLLYSSQDPAIASYITEHWDSLEGLSRDIYDLYISAAQLQHQEDGHSILETSYVIKKTGFQTYSLLPGLLFWDKDWNWDFLPFGDQTDAQSITTLWRFLYERLKLEPSIATIGKIKALLFQASQSASLPTSLPENHTFRQRCSSLLVERLQQFQLAPLLSVLPPTMVPVASPVIVPSSTIVQSCNQLVSDLTNMPTGDGARYEVLVKKILETCFADEFAPFYLRVQEETYNGKRRRDFIVYNIGAREEFWRYLRLGRGLEQIVFDAKNYKHPIHYNQITETLRYLRNPVFGNLIILITRQGLKDYEEVLEDYDREQRVTLALNDFDVIAMLERKAAGESASSFLQEKYFQFRAMK